MIKINEAAQAMAKKRWENTTPEERQIEVKKNVANYWSQFTPEERSERMKAVRKGQKGGVNKFQHSTEGVL